MKKLFATLLAATMVAGTAVSAFAAVETSYTPADDGADYTLAHVVLDDKGKEIKPTDNISGGDKLYYPILVSQGALDKDAYKKDKYYLANYNSEVEKVTARIKNVKNGKYLKDPKIVRKDVAGLYTTTVATAPKPTEGTVAEKTTAEITLDFSAFEVGTGANKLSIGNKSFDVVAGDKEKTLYDKITLAKDDVIVFNAKNYIVKDAINASGILKLEAKEAGLTDLKANDIASAINDNATSAVQLPSDKVTVKNGTDGADTKGNVTSNTIEKDAIPANSKLNLTFGGKTISIVATGKLADDLNALKEKYNNLNTDYIMSVPNSNSIQFEQRTASKTPMPTDFDLNIGYAAKDNKVYCVEVVLGDYFGSEEKELEFDLELRNKGKLEYSTKDNNANDPLTYFNLGNDATDLVAGRYIGAKGDETTKRGKVKKFRNGDLELEITADTDSVKLEEATLSDGKTVEDVENIYLEGKDISFTFDVKASGQDDLFLSVNKDSNKKVVQANEKADIEFVNFPGKPEFDFTGLFKYTVEDPDIKYYFYEIVDDKPVKTSAKYNKEDECFELRTRTLGSYAISDKELEAAENPADKDADKPATDKPTTETPVNPTTPGKNVPTGALA